MCLIVLLNAYLVIAFLFSRILFSIRICLVAQYTVFHSIESVCYICFPRNSLYLNSYSAVAIAVAAAAASGCNTQKGLQPIRPQQTKPQYQTKY